MSSTGTQKIDGESGPDSHVWLLPFGLLVMAIIAVPLLVLGEHGLPRYELLRTELGEIERENAALRSEVEALARETEALRTDLGTIERIARDELGMVREGEIVLEF